MPLRVASKLARACRHVGLAWRDRRFDPYSVRIDHGGVEFDFWVASATGEAWYTRGDAIHDRNGTLVHPSLEMETLLDKLVRPGDVVFECGGHHGFSTVPLALSVGDVGRVVVFEPHPFNAKVICRNLELNQCANVAVEEQAVGEHAGEIEIVARTNAFVEPTGPLSLRRLGNRLVYRKHRVPSVTLDDYAGQQGITPTLLKIDVEGYELSVLRGARGILSGAPKILLEIHPEQVESFGGSVAEVLDLVDPTRYDTWLLWEDERGLERVEQLGASQITGRVHLYACPRA